MQPSARQQELERLYNQRKGHVPHISISDDNHHVTEAIGSYYGNESPPAIAQDARPYSFVTSPSEGYESSQAKKAKRNGSFFDMKAANRVPLARAPSNEKIRSPTDDGGSSPKGVRRAGSLKSENSNGASPTSPPPLTRQSSTDTAIQQFPLNDIDYESSPAAVAQELSNLQAIRRMSMNVDAADPDLPSFGGGGIVPTVAPTGSEDEDDTSRLFWVPARLHPELAPKEFKTFIEDRVDQIRRRSGDSDTLSVDGLERSGSGSSSLRRKKSMLSHQIDTRGTYEDGAERLERKRSRRMPVEGQTQVDLSELESLVSDPAQLMRRMSLDTARRSQDSGIEVPPSEDMPILPPVGQSLKRSTRTTYRRGSLKKGERVPFSKRARDRQTESETDEPTAPSPIEPRADEPILGLTRVQTEPTPPPPRQIRETYPSRNESSSQRREPEAPNDSGGVAEQPPGRVQRSSAPTVTAPADEQAPPRPQPRQFQSRLATGGRTTAQLPGYNNTNPLPQIFETLPDGTKVPVANTLLNPPERKSSHEIPRPSQRGGAHLRPVPGREHQRSSTLDDISSRPSPLPGSGSTSTDALTMVPTFDDRRTEKKDAGRKSSWKWILGNDDDDKDRKAKEDKKDDAASPRSAKSSKLTKPPADKARLDVLQSSIDGTLPKDRGRESIVLNREDIKLEEERRKEGKRSAEPKKDKEKDSGLLSAIFGGKKKSSDSDLKEKKRKSDRGLSPDPTPRILKPDIDYNWTRFSILEERAIYRMAHIKLANPRRALYSQVLLSNFMYSYLAKVQMMHPQVQIPPAHQKNQQRGVKQQEEQQQQQQQPAEYSQYQRWQQQQDRDGSNGNAHQNDTNSKRASLDIATGAGASQPQQRRGSYDYGEELQSSDGYDTRSSEEYEYDHSYQQSIPPGRTNGASVSVGVGGGGGGGGRGGYSVAGTHDYLGYPKGQQPFDARGGLWEDEEKAEELW